jgi:hypothetical protein
MEGDRGVPDLYLKKPKYLILSGIHGREKTAVMSTYQFCKDLAEGKRVPEQFREGAIFVVMPIGTPYSFNDVDEKDQGGRLNAKGVNINRNFDYNWSATCTDPLLNPGKHAGSEKETQVIMKWLTANKDAKLFIDHHNSSRDGYKEVAMLVGLNNQRSKEAKHTAMAGLDRVIPRWKEMFKGKEKVYSYSSFVNSGGLCIYWADNALNLKSIVLESCTRQDDSTKSLTPTSITVGAEALGNMLLEEFDLRDNVNYAEAGQFAVADGKGGIQWVTAYTTEEVAY